MSEETKMHQRFEQQFGRHGVEIGVECTEPYVSVLRDEYELTRQYFNLYQDAFKAFSLVQVALNDVDDEGYGYEEKTNE